MAERQTLELRDEVETTYTGDDLPAQMGAPTPSIMPGISLFQLPANLDQLWDTFDIEKKDENGATLTHDVDGKQVPVVEQHLMLKISRDNPMVVVSSSNEENVGLPASTTMSTLGRKRGKKNDPDAPVVADLTYLLRTSLNDKTPIAKRKDWIPAVSKHAGEVIRLEHGLSGYCDPERVRYIDDGAGGSIEDPDGTHGCGLTDGKKEKSRLYSNDFKTQIADPNDETGHKQITVFTDRALCKNCGALVRGFFRVERFLPPLAK